MGENQNGSQNKPPEIDYNCIECKAIFKATQGSRRYLCPECLSKALSAPKVRTKGGE